MRWPLAAGVALVATLSHRAGTFVSCDVIAVVARAFPLERATPSVRAALPTLSTDATTLTDPADAALSIELMPLDVLARRAERAGDGVLFRGAATDTDVVWVANGRAIEELRVLWSKNAPSSARYRIRAGSGAREVRVANNSVEVLDAAGTIRLATAPLVAVDARGTRRAVHAEVHRSGDGYELATSLDTDGLTYPIVVDPAWATTSPMSVARQDHTATRLKDGRILVIGGRNGGTILSTGEIFNPATKTWSSTAALSVARASHSATLLPSGRVLVVGGTSNGSESLASAQLYDPTSNTWMSAAPMTRTRSAHTATLLGGEKVLVAGGTDLSPGGQTAAAEQYDAATNAWSSAGSMATIRQDHTATLLSSGLVLVAGGRRAGAVFLRGAELFDPTAKTWSSTSDLRYEHSRHAAALLSGDRVLVTGGNSTRPPVGSIVTQAESELFDPTTRTWTLTSNPMTTARVAHTATSLPGDRVLVVGGDGSGRTVDLFSLSDARFIAYPPLMAARGNHASVLLADGQLLVTGGVADGVGTATVEILPLGQPGDACTNGVTECASGHCVDGVCCNAACAGQCEACDVAGSRGTCVPLVGKPHGARAACSDGGGNTCAARSCDGVDRTSCIAYAGEQTTCAAATCTDGAARVAATCDGKGACGATASVPCAPYACGVAGCKTTCASDADCTGDNVCDTNTARCVVADTTCSPDSLSSQPLDRSQPAKSCAPYLCGADTGKCITSCTSSDVCAPGASCDPESRTCVGAGVADEESGCAYGHRAAGGGLLLLAIASVLSAARRRR